MDADAASNASTEANFAMNGAGRTIELQGTAEAAAFSPSEFTGLLALAQTGVAALIEAQKQAVA
ncbi:MAG: hypothetical protein K8953_02215 [Proteobacteria bacterium]|nr:hypothetical protein [Pseudomonadota bacterium]